MSDLESNAAPDPAAPVAGRSSNAFLAIVLVVILAILGGGGWLVYDKVIKTDDSSSANLPASVLPSSTIAVATADANPSLSEKLNILTFIGKFPSLKSHVTIGAKDDPRQWIVTQILKSAHCPALSYSADFHSWLGAHVALGAVDVGAKDPAPVLALETSSGSAASRTIQKIVACDNTKDFFFQVVDGYVVGSDTQAHLTSILSSAKSHPLSADATYRKWSSAVGGQGLVNFYVAPRALKMLLGSLGALPACDSDILTKALGQFTGMAGSLNATDDGLELIARVGTNQAMTSGAALGQTVAQLPSDTALVLGVAPSSKAKTSALGALPSGCGGAAGLPSPARIMELIQQRSGLSLPGDLNTLLGKAFVLTLGGNAPSDLSQIQGPSAVPLGIEVQGDTAKIRAVLAKVEKKLGVSLARMGLVEKVAGGRFILATNQSYAGAISTTGALGADPAFLAAVPGASKAQFIMFVRIDSAWRTAILNSVGQPGDSGVASAAANTAGLSAFGLAGWIENGAVVIDMKLTTK